MMYAGLAFILVFLSFLFSYWLLQLRPERLADEHLDRRLEPVKRASLTQGLDLLRRIKPVSTLPIVQRALGKVATARALGPLIEQSGLSITVGGLLLAIGFFGLLGFVIFYSLTYSSLLGAVMAGLAGLMPWLLVKRAATRRVKRLEEQFPEAIELISRALRAGHAFTTGMGMVAEQMLDPIKTEFRMLHDRQNFGMPLAEAMRDFAARMPLLDARFFVTAVLTQRDSGGNLSEVLDGLASIIRDRFRLRREVRSLSAHGRITGTVLFSLAPVITALLFLIAPQHISLLFTDPIGLWMVSICLVLQVIGFFTMRRIIDIEI
jgi:tight adherence protein B